MFKVDLLVKIYKSKSCVYKSFSFYNSKILFAKGAFLGNLAHNNFMENFLYDVSGWYYI